jgi:flagellar motor switch protein FliN/FliY
MPNDEDDFKEMDIKNADFSKGIDDTLTDDENDALKDEFINDEDDTESSEGLEEPRESTEKMKGANEANLKKASISDLSVRVQVEVSRFDVSLEELMKMEPGYRLPVEINPSQVNLTVNGKLIGRGEIVEIGNQVGVRITELYK